MHPATAIGWAALIGLALAARLAAHLVIGDYRPPWPWEVEVMANSLVERGVLAYDFYGLTELRPTAFLPPVYPFFVAAVRWLAGPDFATALRLAQIAVSTASVVLVVPIGRRMTGSRAAGWLAGFAAAAYPAFVIASVQVNTVTVEIALIELFGLALLAWAARPRAIWLAAAGLALGLLALTRGPALLIWPFVGFWLLVVYPARGLHRRIAWIAVFSLCLVAPQVPWAIRNQAAIGSPITISTNGGLNFWIGHNPAADGEFLLHFDVDRDLSRRAAELSEPDRDRLYYRLGWEYLTTHPAEEIDLSRRKLWYHVWFRPNLGSSYPDSQRFQGVAQLALIGSYAGAAGLGLIGLWWTRRDWRRLFVIYGIAVAYAASSVIYFAATRFRAPFEPFLIVFAAAGAIWLAGLVRSRPRPAESIDEPRPEPVSVGGHR